MGGGKSEEVENSEKQRRTAWLQIQRELFKLPTHGFLASSASMAMSFSKQGI